MIPLAVSYASPSVLESGRDSQLLGLAANDHRPVRLVARVRNPLLFRFCLQTLGSLVWSDDTWISDDEWTAFTLDPVVTVHPDRIMFEAFSRDQSAYGLLIIDRDQFETSGQVSCGTTNVDFTAWLYGALAEMRSSRTTTFRVEAGGIEVSTRQAGGRFEQKVELPESWVRGFLNISAAMAFPGTRLRAEPVDMLAVIRYLQQHKAKTAPRALRYEMIPGREAEIVVEPFETRFPLVGANHGYPKPRIIRTWGRRRLRLIEPLLPYAEHVEIYLKGRAMPSFYAVGLPGYTFVLGLSGWTANSLTTGTGFAAGSSVSDSAVDRALMLLQQQYHIDVETLCAAATMDKPTAMAALETLIRRGRAVFDVQARRVRYRELLAEPIDEAKIYPPDPRLVQVERWQREGAVHIRDTILRKTTKTRQFKLDGQWIQRQVDLRDRVLTGRVGEQEEVEVVLDDEGRIIFGRCGCDHFVSYALSKGPCAHLMALERQSRRHLHDPSALKSTANPISSLPNEGTEVLLDDNNEYDDE